MKALKSIALMLVVLGSLMMFADMAFAQTKDAPKDGVTAVAPLSGKPMGAGLGAGIVLIGAGLGFGKIGAAALESMARQPEAAGRIQTAMIIVAALLEGATFFALVVCISL